MKTIKLKPHIHKIKGARNYALYDLMEGDFYTLAPEGNVEELKNALKEGGLTFETEGCVPFKVELDMSHEKREIKLRQLQIRLNGRPEDNCWNRKKNMAVEKQAMDMRTLKRLKELLYYIPVKSIRIEAESPDNEKIEYILNEFPYNELTLFIQEGVKEQLFENYREICRKKGTSIALLEDGKPDMKDLKVEIHHFFYSRYFNPCLGHTVAVDCNGEIKPCLWWDKSLGTIFDNDLKDMILTEVFDRYWEASKDSIQVCKDCELRYACSDCRCTGTEDRHSLDKKPTYCNYNPFTGE